MRNVVSLTLALIGLLMSCAPAHIQPEPVPPVLERVPPAPESVSTAIEEAPRPAQVRRVPLVSEPQPQPYIHEVRWPGETLSHIARWYTGAEKNWEKIAKANPGLKPRRVQIGDKILIPEELLKLRKAMPRDFVHTLASPQKPPSARSVQPSKGAGKEELFGPAEILSPPVAAEKIELYGPIDLDQTPERPQPSPKGR